VNTAPYLRELDRRLSDAKLAADQARYRDIAARTRRAEERLLQLTRDAPWRSRRKGETPVLAALDRHGLQLEMQGVVVDAGEAAGYQVHIRELARQHGITVSHAARPASNGYAWRGRRAVEVAPIVTQSYAFPRPVGVRVTTGPAGRVVSEWSVDAVDGWRAGLRQCV